METNISSKRRPPVRLAGIGLWPILILIILLGLGLSSLAQAAATEVFSENFESGLEYWNLEQGWEVVNADANNVLRGTRHSFAEAYLGGNVVTLEAKVKILEGGLHINFRAGETADGQARYFLGLNGFGSYLQKESGGMNFQELATGGKGIALESWHQIRITIQNGEIRISVDGNLLFDVEDANIIEDGGIGFETLDNSLVYIDDVMAEIAVPEAREIKSGDMFSGGEHKGDITLEGGDFLILENGKFSQFGNIYVKDRARLLIRNAELKISRHEKLLNHWGIELSGNAVLDVSNSKLLPGEGALFIVNARDSAKVKMKDSPTKLHLFQMFDRAKAEVDHSEIIGEIGGLVSASGGASITIANSKIGAVSLDIPKDAMFEASGLGTGFFKDWNLQRDTKVSGIDYNIILRDTELVPDRIGPGPFERGWPVFIDSGANVKITDSQLRKVVIELHDEKAEFSGLVTEKPTNFHYRDIAIENVSVMGQWGIFLHGSSDVVVRDSEDFWTFIFDDSRLRLINTHMDEFDPRDFRGELIFENSSWDTAAEIIKNNDFTMSGSLEIGEIGGMSWENSKVTRKYGVIGKPNSQLTLTKDNQSVWSGVADENGRAEFELRFDDANFNDTWQIKDTFGNEREITFFSNTPVNMNEGIVSIYAQKITRFFQSPPPPQFFKIFLPFFLLLAVILFFFAKKNIWNRSRQK